MRNINCKWNDRGAWCKNENIKCSLFGVGARCCIEFDSNKTCKFKSSWPKPKYPPPSPFPPKRPPPPKKVELLSYKILGCVTTQELEVEVNAHIEKGFVPLGRPFLAQSWYHQAIKQIGFKK